MRLKIFILFFFVLVTSKFLNGQNVYVQNLADKAYIFFPSKPDSSKDNFIYSATNQKFGAGIMEFPDSNLQLVNKQQLDSFYNYACSLIESFSNNVTKINSDSFSIGSLRGREFECIYRYPDSSYVYSAHRFIYKEGLLFHMEYACTPKNRVPLEDERKFFFNSFAFGSHPKNKIDQNNTIYKVSYISGRLMIRFFLVTSVALMILFIIRVFRKKTPVDETKNR